MTIIYHDDVEQGSDEWKAMRCGILTASETKHVITAGKAGQPETMKAADNEKTRSHVYELAAQRLTKYVEPHYIGDHMLRGMDDELIARELYNEKIAPVKEVGFITNDRWGFKIGYSPDGLVGDDGQIEAKSRLQKFQIEIITTREIPTEHIIQLQTGLAVSERKWVDFISYSGGLPMYIQRVYPDPIIINSIRDAADIFESKVVKKMADYNAWVLEQGDKIILTERTKPIEEIV